MISMMAVLSQKVSRPMQVTSTQTTHPSAALHHTQIDDGIAQVARTLGAVLTEKHCTVTAAESCTGGGVAYAMTAVAGSSQWFQRSFVVYSNKAKREVLSVKARTITQHGEVSEAVVKEMAQGALKRAKSQLSVAISGIAGPDGGSQEKPVGTVWFAWGCALAGAADTPEVACMRFDGDRERVRKQAIFFALQGLLARAQRLVAVAAPE